MAVGTSPTRAGAVPFGHGLAILVLVLCAGRATAAVMPTPAQAGRHLPIQPVAPVSVGGYRILDAQARFSGRCRAGAPVFLISVILLRDNSSRALDPMPDAVRLRMRAGRGAWREHALPMLPHGGRQLLRLPLAVSAPAVTGRYRFQLALGWHGPHAVPTVPSAVQSVFVDLPAGSCMPGQP